MASAASTGCNVQHVTKASSDELLRKFADSEPAKASPKKTQLIRAPLAARRKRPPSRRAPRASSVARDYAHGGGEGPGSERLVEWKALLQHPPSRRSALLCRIGRSELTAREIAGVDFILAALVKTWRKTVEGASRILVEKHCDRHVRLISDMV